MRRFFLVMLSLVLVGALADAGTVLARRSGQPVNPKPSTIHVGKMSSSDWSKWYTIQFTNKTGESVYFTGAIYTGDAQSQHTRNSTCGSAASPIANGASCTIDVQIESPASYSGKFIGGVTFDFTGSDTYVYTTNVHVLGRE